MSTMLKEKCALAKLRAELKGRKGKLCRCYKKLGHLARNCRNKGEEKRKTTLPQNKYEVLKSRVMQCGVEEKVVRSVRREVVRCFKCREEGHKYRECPLGEKKVKRVARPDEGKAHQKEREREARRVEKEETARPVKGEAQQEWRRSSMEELRKRTEEHCGKGVPEETQLLELGYKGIP